MGTEAADNGNLSARRRTERRDPRLPLAETFDPSVVQGLWDYLPHDFQIDHVDTKNASDRLRGAIRLQSAGGPWTTCYINMRDLPEPMTQEIA